MYRSNTRQTSEIAEKSIPQLARNARQGIANPCQLPFSAQKKPTICFDFSTVLLIARDYCPKNSALLLYTHFLKLQVLPNSVILTNVNILDELKFFTYKYIFFVERNNL